MERTWTTSSHLEGGLTETASFDVFTATHDQVMAGSVDSVRSRVVLLAEDHSLPYLADLAACVAASIHGGMPTRVLYRE